jgi:hypothetical protein
VPACILHVLGDNFSPDDFLAKSKLPVLSCFLKGTARPGRARAATTSGFTCQIGSDNATFSEQTEHSLAFLKTFQRELAPISSMPAVESFYLELAYDCRLNDSDCVVQRDFLPAELLAIAGGLGVGICLTLFPKMTDR